MIAAYKSNPVTYIKDTVAAGFDHPVTPELRIHRQSSSQEAVRIDPPVTSCTNVSKEERAYDLLCLESNQQILSAVLNANLRTHCYISLLKHSRRGSEVVRFRGREYTMKENTLNQYTLSMANRDPSVFTNPDVFDPTRKDCR